MSNMSVAATTNYLRQNDNTDDDNVLAGLLAYLAGIMCASSDTCSDLAEIIMGTLCAVGSMAIAYHTPSYSYHYNMGLNNVEKAHMGLLSSLCIVGAIYAAKIQYDHNLKYNYNPDTLDRWNAGANAYMGGALVNVIFTGLSSALVKATAPTMLTMYTAVGNAGRKCFNGVRDSLPTIRGHADTDNSNLDTSLLTAPPARSRWCPW